MYKSNKNLTPVQEKYNQDTKTPAKILICTAAKK